MISFICWYLTVGIKHRRTKSLEKSFKWFLRHCISWVIALMSDPAAKPSMSFSSQVPSGGLEHFGVTSSADLEAVGTLAAAELRGSLTPLTGLLDGGLKSHKKRQILGRMEKFSIFLTSVFVVCCCFMAFWGKHWRFLKPPEEFIGRWCWWLGGDGRPHQCRVSRAWRRAAEIQSADTPLKFISVWTVDERNMHRSRQKVEVRPGPVV